MTTVSALSNRAPRSGGVRFAPSPTGHFHLGNLRTAWISWTIAQRLGLPWIVRMEDIDRARVLPWASAAQLGDMNLLGLTPSILLTQSEYEDRHWDLFISAVVSEQIYPCDCSRREVLQGLASAPHDGTASVYTGVCRPLRSDRVFKASESIAWRFRMPPESGHEDFIIARSSTPLREGLPVREGWAPAYHWACAIDDYDGGYDWLVRCVDLASAAALQRAIHFWICGIEEERPAPRVFHTSLVVDETGHRLEKRTKGVTLMELLAAGWTADRLTERFRLSFSAEITFAGDGAEGPGTRAASSILGG